MREANGRIAGLRGTVQDITERKQAEGRILQISGELHQKNKELQYFNNIMVDREIRMIEMKKEVDALCQKLGEPKRYAM